MTTVGGPSGPTSEDPVLDALARRRKELGLSQSELARMVGTSQSAISDLLNGSSSPTLYTLRKVCEALKLGLGVWVETDEPFVDSRNPLCVEQWSECWSGGYDPKCCRFPKSCSC